MLGDFANSSFDGLFMAFGVKDLLTQGSESISGSLFDFAKLGTNDGKGFSLRRDGRMLGIELREKSFQIGNGIFCYLSIDFVIMLDCNNRKRILVVAVNSFKEVNLCGIEKNIC